MPKFEIVDSRTVRDSDGREHDVIEAIGALPWVSQLCPQMPHQYVVLGKSDPLGYAVLEAMVRSSNPHSYRAYFRGYQSPNRYWEAPDGLRYWSTRFMLNRCAPDSVEPLRRVADGAKPISELGWSTVRAQARSSPKTWCNSSSPSRRVDQLAISSVGTSSWSMTASMVAIVSGRK